ncbi:DUF4124 domain-containing protein [Sulfuriferula nivalis]|uniref:DUF4124 domain-containing protein n=1 Tax=Sulfuriferula nivalis TaxID=2675298 RepID=A0A809RCP7_9PROT|nr:DUF4124 domain-containing protein [Sulfuriferula nivalis]BBO99425.1 hypothetical protein SFSGTM_01340 [Sulfuriferula nivalis]
MHKTHLKLLLPLLLTSLSAHAEIYKIVAPNGEVTYTDKAVKGSKRLDLGPMPSSTPVLTNKSTHSTSSRNTSTPSDFPRIDSNTQNQRDSVRRRVLTEELNTEEQALEDAVNAKKDGETLRAGEKASSPGYLTRIDKLDHAIKLHQDNIHALRKELSTVK